jgi:hypothetical protein
MTDTTNGQAFYKGFDENMQCRGFQYAEGETYVHEGRANVCRSGFHACESPLDTLSYYPPSNSVYRQVQLEGVKKSEGGDSKVAGRKIKIGAKLSLMDLAKLHVDFVMENVKPGDHSAATNTGHHSAATVSGKDSIAVVTGYASKARGARGCWIVLTERDPHRYTIKEVRAVCVDGETVKAGVFYTLQDGELVEVGE